MAPVFSAPGVAYSAIRRRYSGSYRPGMDGRLDQHFGTGCLWRMGMRSLLMIVLLCVPFGSTCLADSGLVKQHSHYGVKVTADRLERALAEKGMTLFLRVDHSANARSVDMALPPTELLLFGNPKAGTPFMQCGHDVAIDLPQKALIWQDEQGKTWLAYNDPAYLAGRHGIKGCGELIAKISKVLAGLAEAATQP